MHLVRQNQTLDAAQILKLAGITIEPPKHERKRRRVTRVAQIEMDRSPLSRSE
jgi:hypothetical protein